MKKNTKKKVVKFRATQDLKNILKAKALIYTKGNVSEFIRYCVENYQERSVK